MSTKRYAVGNNTDYDGRSFETNNYRLARREWNRIRPRAHAGNRYAAWFVERCEECGEWHDVAPQSAIVQMGARQCVAALDKEGTR